MLNWDLKYVCLLPQKATSYVPLSSPDCKGL